MLLTTGGGRHSTTNNKCPESPNNPRHLLIFQWRCRN